MIASSFFHQVDSLLERDGRFYPIEARGTSSPGRKHASGLRAYRAAHPDLKVETGLVLAPTDSAYPLAEHDRAAPWTMIPASP